MNGKELYTDLVSKRDFSGSETDSYAQLLQTIYHNIGSKIFPLLEKAQKENKKLSIKEFSSEILVDEFSTSDIVIS